MLRRWFSRGLRGPDARPGARRAPAGDPVDATFYRGAKGSSRGVGETKGGQDQEEMWRTAALRAMGSLGLVFFCSVAVLWFFVFRGSAWQALLSLSFGGFLGSWIAALWGVRGVADRRRKRATFSAGSDAATRLARCGIFIGMFGFVAFFLIAYR